jgi:DNA-binding transcriptional MerR regulator
VSFPRDTTALETTMTNKALVAFTLDRVARLTGFSERQLTYWSKTGLIRPMIDRKLTPHRPIRLYSYDDVLGLLIIGALQEKGISNRYVREIVEHIRRQGLKMSELRFAIAGSRVHFQTPDGVWEDAERPQPVIAQVLDLKPLKARLKASMERDPELVGHIERRRGSMGSKELVAGTRIPVSAVERFLARGIAVADILQAYPGLQEGDVEAIRHHLASA